LNKTSKFSQVEEEIRLKVKKNVPQRMIIRRLKSISKMYKITKKLTKDRYLYKCCKCTNGGNRTFGVLSMSTPLQTLLSSLYYLEFERHIFRHFWFS